MSHSIGMWLVIEYFIFPIVNCQSCTNLQFVCGDGKCLNRNNDDNGVCDRNADCSDVSDESQCKIWVGN